MEIKLGGTKGGTCLIDEEDYEYLSQFSLRKNDSDYIVNGHGELIHRLLMNAKPGEFVDHINHIKSDIRKYNLKKKTRSGNNNNMPKHKNSSSKYYGVYKKNDSFQVAFNHNSDRHYLGLFNNEMEAATAYDIYVIKNKLDKPLNFPENINEYILDKNINQKKEKLSAYVGVTKYKNKYAAYISINKKRYNLLRSEDEILCAKAYDKYIVDNNIEGRKLNFPDDYPDFNPERKIKTFYEDFDEFTIKLIINNKSVLALIDRADYDLIKYYTVGVCSAGYLVIYIPGMPVKRLHKFLTNTGEEVFIDHIDGNKTNDTRKNLRHSNPTKNAQNMKKKEGKTSNYIGVHYFKRDNKWRAAIRHNGRKNLGLHINQENAARCRDLYILDNCQGEHFPLNFNDWTEENITYWKQQLNIQT